MTDFSGFARPTSSYYRLPNDWFDIWQETRKKLSTGNHPARIIAPLKVVEYVIKRTWGFSNLDKPIRLSHSDLREGRRGKRNQRLDAGTGLASETTLQRGIKLAVALGMLEQHEDNSDAARQTRFYLPRLRDETEDDENSAPNTINGFDRPTSNYFIVPHSWTNLSANIGSEVLILTIEYFFRHTWGWQISDREIRWLDADDVATGRCYRSQERRGERYDQGIGYTVRQVRDTLEEGVQREFLVWRERDDGSKEFTLRMSWMTGIDSEGYFDPDVTNETGITVISTERSITSGVSTEKSVGVEEKTVEGAEKVVEVEEKTVEGAEKSVGGGEKDVGVEEKTVEGTEKSVGGEEKHVDRTCQDTSRKTYPQTLRPNTTTTTPQAVVVPSDPQEYRPLFFCPASENGEQGMSRCLTLDDASQVILTEPGTWYWSEADLAQPKVGDSAEIFTNTEIAVQIALDHHLFGQDYAIVEEGDERRHLLMVEAVREQLAKKLTSTFVYLDLWQLLELPRPSQVGPQLAERQKRLACWRTQASAWGDPDLVVALEQINLSVDDTRELIKRYGAGRVGGWLRALRSNPAEIRSLASVLISRLRKGSIPPGDPMTIIEYSPIPPERDRSG